jgi:hemerythrin
MIQWSEKYAVGFEIIDQQHQKFFKTFNKLYDAFLRGDEEQKLEEVLLELAEYAEHHFNTEEKYFKEFHYEGAEEHIMEHDIFRNQIAQFQKSFHENFNRKELADDLVELLDDWMVKHVIEMDQKYARCFREHGLK